MFIKSFNSKISVNIRNTFELFSKTKRKLVKEWHCLTFLEISLKSGLIGDSRILVSASPFNML